MSVPRDGQAAISLADGRVLVAGGSGGPGCGGLQLNAKTLTSVEIFDPTTGKWTSAADMRVGRSHFTLTLLTDGEVLAAGGQGQDGRALSSAEVYDPKANVWRLVGSMQLSRAYQTATLLAGGQVLVTGGYAYDANTIDRSETAELFDLQTQTFRFTGKTEYARVNHTATLLSAARFWSLVGLPRRRTHPPSCTIL
jgi:hypothetical protein